MGRTRGSNDTQALSRIRKGRPVLSQGWTALARTTAHDARQMIMRTTFIHLRIHTPPQHRRRLSELMLDASFSSSLSLQHHVLAALYIPSYLSEQCKSCLCTSICPPRPIATKHITTSTSPSHPVRHTQLPHALLRHPLSQDTRIARPEALAKRVPTCTR